MTTDTGFVLAAVQATPVFFDREASTEKACQLIEEAAGAGATIAAFGECWLPGYPLFAPPSQLWWEALAEYVANAVEIPGPFTDRLCAAARRAGVDVVIGVLELDPVTRGTVYCTLLFIGREGMILGRHRKLKPTFREREVWGDGDALGLVVHERPYARISGLNCWEHNMVLPGYALMTHGTQVHVAAWPGRELDTPPPAPISNWTRQLLLSRAFASQAAAYVIAAAGTWQESDIPERYRSLFSLPYAGSSVIIDPRGEIIAGPAEGETILTAKGSLREVRAAKLACDVGGHYSRPDIFQLKVQRRPTRGFIDERPNSQPGFVPADRIPATAEEEMAPSSPDGQGGMLSPMLDT
jgi:predicted amidohydrolase